MVVNHCKGKVFIVVLYECCCTNKESRPREHGYTRTSRRRQVLPEEMDSFVEIDDYHSPNFDRLEREFEWESPELTDFRCHVAYRSLLHTFQATFVPVSNANLSPDQGTVIVQLLTHGISLSEVTQAMMRIGMTEAASSEIVGSVREFIANELQPTSRAIHGLQGSMPPEREAGADVKSVLYYIAEEQSKQKAYIHHGIRCDSCGEMPICGTRWHCSNCTDFDLCSTCEAQTPSPHIKTHVFHKITIPALHLSKSWKVEPVWYPGNPFLMQRTLPKDLVKQLSNDCSYEPFEVEAIYDQFTCVANTEWKEDPLNINAAIDRSAFSRSIMPHTRLRPPQPNLIYERCFAFYDTDNNGLIGFDEFLHGLAYIHKKAFRDQRLAKIFDGYDMDSDGFVSRKDFLRMFRALYTVQQQLTDDMIAVQEEQAADEPRLDLINSSQPLSSAFRERFLPGSLDRRPGKNLDRFGDLMPLSGFNAIVDGSRGSATRTDGAGTSEAQMDGTTQSVQERWRHRNFHMGEEERIAFEASEAINEAEFNGDEEVEATEDVGNENGPNHGDEFARRSRSSSRVRFKDELEDDIRSQTSTSSRPIGERWGGYEIPEAESDVGKEVIYNMIQESFNLLLDPLFKTSENCAAEITRTEEERQKWKDEIVLVEREMQALEEYNSRQLDPLLETAKPHREYSIRADAKGSVTANALMQEVRETLGMHDCLTVDDYDHITKVMAKLNGYIDWALDYMKVPHESQDMEICSKKYKSHVEEGRSTADAIMEKIRHAYPSAPTAHQVYRELSELWKRAMLAEQLVCSSTQKITFGAFDRPKIDKDIIDTQEGSPGSPGCVNPISRDPPMDPTLPQFLPNSATDISHHKESDAPVWSEAGVSDTDIDSMHSLLRPTPPQPSRSYLRDLARLDQMEREQRKRGGGRGKLSFEEFEREMKGSAGAKLKFLDDWLTLVSF